MKDYIKKIASLHERFQVKNNTPTAIFGTAGTLQQNIKAQVPYRVAVWPTTYQENPALGVGLMSALAYLLDSLNDARAYILFLDTQQIEAGFEWKQAQFGIEHWQPKNLDENVALAAVLSRDDTGWKWVLEIENDLVDENDPNSTFSLTYSAPLLSGIINQLPDVINALMKGLGSESVLIDVYDSTDLDDERLTKLLAHVGEWQVNLNRSLLDLPFITGNIYESTDTLARIGASNQDSFNNWLASTAISYSLLPGYNNNNPEMIDAVLSAVETLQAFPFANIYIGNALYNLGDADAGYKLLEQAVENHPTSSLAWLILADAYRRAGNANKMIDTFQRAIEVEAATARLYRNYGTVLELLNAETPLQEVILIDPSAYEDSLALWEAIGAYDEALKLEPDSLVALQRRTMLLSDLANDAPQRFIDSFKQLLEADQTGEAVRAVLDQLHDLDDYDPIFDALEASQEAQPNRIDLKVNLGVAYLAGEEFELAGEEFEAVLAQTEDKVISSDVSRLLLSADDPDFESHLAEIESQTNGNAIINSSDIDFLYEAIEKAPLLSDAYTILGKALHRRSESEDALEVLLEGYQHHPQDPELILQIGIVMWETGREEEALNYLNRGLVVNPNYVPLLATTGQFLFEDQQDDEYC
jgi:tetratricopeptide (TPR) repeat protein